MASSGNFAVLNDKIKSSTNDITIGNCRITSSSGGWGSPLTLAANTGKFYVEINFVVSDTNGGRIAVLPTNSAKYNDGDSSAAGSGDYAIEWKYDGDSNFITNNGSTTQSSVGGWAQGDVAAVAFDLDASPKTVQFYKNNSTIGSAENINTSAEGPFTVMIYAHNAGTWHINAGQDSTFGANETAGGNADGNGFGDFYYSPPSGFLALCSGNLPISDDIDPAQTDDDYPAKQMNVLTYTGNGSTRSITGLGFKPDCIFLKARNYASVQQVYDSTRGGTKQLYPSQPGSEATYSYLITSFDNDGWSMGNGDTDINYSSRTFVTWCFRANGGTTSTNSDGSTDSTVQANTKAGFSIITYTGNGSNRTIGHGLSSAPDFMMFKNRDASSNWVVYARSQGAGNRGQLNTSNAWGASSTSFQSTDPDNSVITLGTSSGTNANTNNFICYAWHSVEGYSKFGTFKGNGSTDGPFIYTGFRPRFLFIKRTDTGASWYLLDTERDTNNPVTTLLGWDLTSTESDIGSTNNFDVLSNGLKIRTSGGGLNGSGGNFIFGAWGDVSFKYNNTF